MTACEDWQSQIPAIKYLVKDIVKAQELED
jgi:uncharacterized protein (DUF305 family)